ncbi:peptidoglycan-binding domain-containing protein [Sagittula sp. SSi028]|uniref:peptidoglycan-binding domain-containing protein n=1 Tax=Sagittula sp. SSi028 TaxID=3400636 RepID=UPI003AF7AFED
MTGRLGRALVAGALTGIVMAGQAGAEPCVGAAFDLPFPGATGVQTRRADVPSPRFPGLWQEGRINGHAYVLYANGEATIEEGAEEPAWSVFVQCDLEAATCDVTQEGDPPANMREVGEMMGRCFVAPDEVRVLPPPAPDPVQVAPPTEGWALAPTTEEDDATNNTVEPEVAAPEPTVQPEPEPETQPEPAPCGLTTVGDAEPGRALQLLLVDAGADPGPIDGLPGRKTRDALAQVLGEEARALEIPQALDALDALLCTTPD